MEFSIGESEPCMSFNDPCSADLTWLMHRAVSTLTNDFNEVCRKFGLSDLRDCFVLAAINDGTPRTQIEIARTLSIDKTTLVAILDRLEDAGHIVRTSSVSNRRIRIPKGTPQGKILLDQVLQARESVVNLRLAHLKDGEVETLRQTLWDLFEEPAATAPNDPPVREVEQPQH